MEDRHECPHFRFAGDTRASPPFSLTFLQDPLAAAVDVMVKGWLAALGAIPGVDGIRRSARLHHDAVQVPGADSLHLRAYAAGNDLARMTGWWAPVAEGMLFGTPQRVACPSSAKAIASFASLEMPRSSWVSTDTGQTRGQHPQGGVVAAAPAEDHFIG